MEYSRRHVAHNDDEEHSIYESESLLSRLLIHIFCLVEPPAVAE